MSKVKKLLHTRYRVNDLEKTVKFYQEVLGLEEIRRNKSPRGSELAFLQVPGSEEQIEITYFPGSGPVQVQPDLTHLAFEVDNIEEFGKHLASLGLKFSVYQALRSAAVRIESGFGCGVKSKAPVAMASRNRISAETICQASSIAVFEISSGR